ncbi:ORF2 [Simian torque teno virus 31]|uniref:ORF2 n=1 Tax=Simian torque teno virus 31 TaxID=1619219 RepID=A0A0C5IC50_9VIRU|nr:ORF2 [Simian torque teno virus 31]AJP36566.1 ORF2 [Simian torque teno virus 31]
MSQLHFRRRRPRPPVHGQTGQHPSDLHMFWKAPQEDARTLETRWLRMVLMSHSTFCHCLHPLGHLHYISVRDKGPHGQGQTPPRTPQLDVPPNTPVTTSTPANSTGGSQSLSSGRGSWPGTGGEEEGEAGGAGAGGIDDYSEADLAELYAAVDGDAAGR